MEEPTTPEEAATTARAFTRTAATLYLGAFFLAVLVDELLRPVGSDPVLHLLRPGRSGLLEAAVGCGAGLAVVGTYLVLLARAAWMERTTSLLHALVGRPGLLQVLVLAGLSSVVEELLFRGMLQPYLGLLLTSVVFGLLHFLCWQYSLFATVMGVILGALALWSGGGLIAPVACHFTVNVIGLLQLSRSWRPPSGDLSTSPPPS